jgi:hypothetical protein
MSFNLKSFLRGVGQDILANVEKNIYKRVDESMQSNKGGDIRDNIPGDINIQEIVLHSTTGDKTYNLINQAKRIDIYESMFSPIIFADFLIADASNMRANFGLKGEEFITIKYNTPGAVGKECFYYLRVNELADEMPVGATNKVVTYTLRCSSAEYLNNFPIQAIPVRDRNYSDVVREILEKYIHTPKPITIEPTVGLDTQIDLISMERPFVAIDHLKHYSFSGVYKTHSYTFFENKNGFNFVTIEKLMDDGAKTIDQNLSDKEFFTDTIRKEDIRDVNVRNIIAYNKLVNGGTVNQTLAGGLNNVGVNYDWSKGSLDEVTTTHGNLLNNVKLAENPVGSTVSPSFQNSYGASPGTIMSVIPTMDSKNPYSIAQKIGILKQYIEVLAKHIVQIYVYGDSDITVGDMIKCNFADVTSFDNTSGLDRIDTGKYLVSKVRHCILNQDRPQYNMSLELIRGSTPSGEIW